MPSSVHASGDNGVTDQDLLDKPVAVQAVHREERFPPGSVSQMARMFLHFAGHGNGWPALGRF